MTCLTLSKRWCSPSSLGTSGHGHVERTLECAGRIVDAAVHTTMKIGPQVAKYVWRGGTTLRSAAHRSEWCKRLPRVIRFPTMKTLNELGSCRKASSSLLLFIVSASRGTQPVDYWSKCLMPMALLQSTPSKSGCNK